MTLTRPTRQEALQYAFSLQGQSRDRLPVPWTDSPAVDDCARFCSHVLWGGKPGPISWVDNFQTAGDGAYVRGADDLAPADVLLFDWEGNGVGNHVELMVGDLGDGTVRTFGANGSDSREARYRTRPKRYIMGRFRPAWQSINRPTIVHTSKGPVNIMKSHIITLSNGRTYLATEDGRKLWLRTPAQVSFWTNLGVHVVEGRQPAAVLQGWKG